MMSITSEGDGSASPEAAISNISAGEISRALRLHCRSAFTRVQAQNANHTLRFTIVRAAHTPSSNVTTEF